MKSIDYLSRDYEAFRTDMLNQIPRFFPEWTDFSSSDMGVVILEQLAWGLDIISYYQDRITSELFPATATQRQSLIHLFTPLGYKLKEAVPSKTDIVFEFTPHPTEATTIPAGFQVATSGTEIEPPMIFELDQNLVIPAGNTGLEMLAGNYLYTIPVTQGYTLRNITVGSGTGAVNQRFRINQPEIIDGTLELAVNEGAGFQVWANVTTALVQTTSSLQHYWTEVDGDNYTWVIFGNGVDGKAPIQGVNNIRASFRVGGGTKTNVGAHTIVQSITNLARLKRLFNPAAASGGTDRESLESARKNAPRFFRSNVRAVTKSDYEALALQTAGVIKAFATRDTSQVNGVLLYIQPAVGANFETLRNNVLNYINPLKPITTQLFVQPAVTVRLAMEIRPTILENTAVVRHEITQMIEEMLAVENREFGQGLQLFRVYSALGRIDNLVGVEITRATVIPQVITRQATGNAVWANSPTVNPVNTLRGTWRILMTSPTAFTVAFDATGLFTGGQIERGTGTLGQNFTSLGGEITFRIDAGTQPMLGGDNWEFKTQAYVGDIIVAENEILELGNLTIL